MSGLQDQHVQVALPKLTLRTRFELAATLGALGMPVAFTDRADFSGIAGRPGDLRISNVIHEAYLRVDEAGTEAAAATAVGIADSGGTGAGAVQFRVDRPFVFVLRDTPHRRDPVHRHGLAAIARGAALRRGGAAAR